MTYEEGFIQFWEKVKTSVGEGTFAKLTMAKTIGKTNLKNIFVRPIYAEDGFKVLLKHHYRSIDSQDREEELTLEETYEVVKKHLKKSFFTVLLFTTTADITLKVNKKGAASISEGLPTFREIIQAKRDDELDFDSKID